MIYGGRVMKYEKAEFKADITNITEAMVYVEDVLRKEKLSVRERVTAMLITEESLHSVLEQADDGTSVQLSVIKYMGSVRLVIKSQGKQFDFAPEINGQFDLTEDIDDRSTENAIRAIALNAYGDRLRYKHRNGINTVQIELKSSERKNLHQTLGALLLALLVGFLLRSFPDTVSDSIVNYLINPIQTIFLDALHMIAGPVVFFSVVTCISQFEDLHELGRIGAKVMGMYLFTTLWAIAVGFGMFMIFHPGNPVAASFADNSASAVIESAQIAETSILEKIINIVPQDLFSPFTSSNMLQILFMAILVGAAVGVIGDFSRPLKDLFRACNSLFAQITAMIVRCMPLAVFASITSLLVTSGKELLISVLHYFIMFVFGIFILMLGYLILIAIVGRLNPLRFLKKYGSMIIENFSMGPSNTSISENLKACAKLGISNRISAFSIPLGATVNLDGTCIYLVTAGLFLARVFGVEMDETAIVTMIIEVVILSLGTPGVPGSGLICLSVLLVQIGVPAQALSLVMGIDPIVSMFQTMSNTTGDVSVSLIVARSEHMLDIEKYNG